MKNMNPTNDTNFPLLEVCADSFFSCLAASRVGADRVELCGQLVIGGVTPSFSLFQMVKECIPIAVRVLIRPRFGDFLYDGEEIEEMCREIDFFARAGADGVVVGALQRDGALDITAMKELLRSAKGVGVTLHRAFDVSKDPFETLEAAVSLGVDTILTSGQRNSAIEGAELLKALQTAAGGRIRLMAGGGVRSSNLARLHERTGITAFHTSARKKTESEMTFKRAEVSMGFAGVSEYEKYQADDAELAKCVSLVREMKG